ncbi:MAG: hypothetical protein L6277_15640 [Desulfobacterales bacterium]|nr:hypothetical protein [Pseudomonadota bacterium]MBU4354566.1 hypothetical protein [Pseudomonadota bacterium]MCG2773507.1 hypothetical protein [Desulfobacterales bacterium]
MGAWAKFPTKWILQQELNFIVWRKHKSDGIAALLVLIALAVKRNRDKMGAPEDDASIVKATYDEIQDLVAISRIKVSKGLALLVALEIIKRVDNRSHYHIVGIDVPGEWAKLPQERLMQQPGRISVFGPFNLRSKSELDALKLYLLMVAFRSSKTGCAHIGYEKITKYTGVIARDLKKAKSHLISLGLIHVDLDLEKDRENARPPMRYKILGL